jgi:hypothetical protein
MLNVITMSVIMLNAVILSVTTPNSLCQVKHLRLRRTPSLERSLPNPQILDWARYEWEQMNTMGWAVTGWKMRLAGWYCFWKCHWNTVHEWKMGTGDIVRKSHEWYFPFTLRHCRSFFIDKIYSVQSRLYRQISSIFWKISLNVIFCKNPI